MCVFQIRYFKRSLESQYRNDITIKITHFCYRRCCHLKLTAVRSIMLTISIYLQMTSFKHRLADILSHLIKTIHTICCDGIEHLDVVHTNFVSWASSSKPCFSDFIRLQLTLPTHASQSVNKMGQVSTSARFKRGPWFESRLKNQLPRFCRGHPQFLQANNEK